MDCYLYKKPLNILFFTFWAGNNLTLILAQNKQSNPKFNTNNDTYLDIDNELKPILFENIKLQSVARAGEKCTGDKPCPIWVKSTYALQPNCKCNRQHFF